MRIDCPQCGERDIREFSYRGDAVGMDRPEPDAGPAAWDEFVHLRTNPAGATRDLWYHEGGCMGWLVVGRDTINHQISSVQMASNATGTKR